MRSIHFYLRIVTASNSVIFLELNQFQIEITFIVSLSFRSSEHRRMSEWLNSGESNRRDRETAPNLELYTPPLFAVSKLSSLTVFEKFSHRMTSPHPLSPFPLTKLKTSNRYRRRMDGRTGLKLHCLTDVQASGSTNEWTKYWWMDPYGWSICRRDETIWRK